MASRQSCLTEDRIKEVVLEAELEALSGMRSSKWKPGQINTANNAFRPDNALEAILFTKVQEVTVRSFRMGEGTYGEKGGARKKNKSKRMTRRR
jgi:hypothetical protein